MNYNTTTLQTYQDNFQLYIDGTNKKIVWEYKDFLDSVLDYISKDSIVLEVWTSFWRDADYFESKWYNNICRSDAVQWFIDYNISLGKDCMYLNLLDFSLQQEYYDLIFANAVLLHFTYEQCIDIINKFMLWLKKNGILAVKLKNGIWEEWSTHKMNGPRYFRYRTIEELENLFKDKKIQIMRKEIVSDNKRIEMIIKKL
jgi:hypothetical protein